MRAKASSSDEAPTPVRVSKATRQHACFLDQALNVRSVVARTLNIFPGPHGLASGLSSERRCATVGTAVGQVIIIKTRLTTTPTRRRQWWRSWWHYRFNGTVVADRLHGSTVRDTGTCCDPDSRRLGSGGDAGLLSLGAIMAARVVDGQPRANGRLPEPRYSRRKSELPFRGSALRDTAQAARRKPRSN